MVRAGRTIVNYDVKEINFQQKTVLDFSRYKVYGNKIICKKSSFSGYEGIITTDNDPIEYLFERKEFDIIQANTFYRHNCLETILDQLDLPSLTPFYMSDEFGLYNTRKTIEMEVVAPKYKEFSKLDKLHVKTITD